MLSTNGVVGSYMGCVRCTGTGVILCSYGAAGEVWWGHMGLLERCGGII